MEDVDDLEETGYIKLKKSKNIIYAHCRNCIHDMEPGYNPAKWADLEAIIDLKTGILTLGCRRCNLPILCAMVPSDMVKHVDHCGCEMCKTEQ